LNAKIYTQQKDYQNALKTYKSSLQLAQKLNDTEAQAYIYNNVGDIFNKQNNLPKALRCYQESINSTDDIGLKSKSHHKLGNLYNELNKFDPSMEHYFESLAFKGELEDIKNQSKILENIGEMHAKKYSSREAISYFKLGVDLAKETKDTKRMSSIFSKTPKPSTNRKKR
jgi:tetratricopeptide (TPR) repeat protein